MDKKDIEFLVDQGVKKYFDEKEQREKEKAERDRKVKEKEKLKKVIPIYLMWGVILVFVFMTYKTLIGSL